MGSDELAQMAEEVRRVLLTQTAPGDFDPVDDWYDLGLLVQAMEVQGHYLMLNSACEQQLRRTAAFHRTTSQGYPCTGSSEWGPFATVGEAVLRAAHESLIHPRV